MHGMDLAPGSTATAADLRAALEAAADARRVDIPAWMPEGEFFSYHCRAASPAR